MIAEHATLRIDVVDLFCLQQIWPRLESIGFALAPRHIAACSEVVNDLQFQGTIDTPLIAALKAKKFRSGVVPNCPASE